MRCASTNGHSEPSISLDQVGPPGGGRNRELSWDGCVNVRDLGGIATQDGGMTRLGAVVRGDSPYRLSESGWGALTAYGIRALIDLRWPEERAADPIRDLPVTIIHLPLAGDQRTPEAEHDEQPLSPDPPVGRRMLSGREQE